MSSSLIFLCVGIVLWLMGLHGLARLRHLIRRIMAINVMGSGTFMVMIALAQRGEHSDPVLHALVVTGLVVAVSATAFALRLAVAISAHKSRKQRSPELRE